MQRKILAAAILALFATTPALAQYRNPVTPLVAGAPVSGSNPLPISGSFSATLSGFPGSSQTTGTPIAVTTGGVTGSLPAGTVVLATNDGATNTAYCKLGASATTSDVPVYPHSSVAFTVGSATQLTCITSTSTTTVNMSGGSGLPTGWGGGSAAGGGGGGTSLTDEATFTQGTTAFTPVGCTFNNSITNLTSGQAGAFSCTAARSLHSTVDNVNSNGSATSANSSPVVIASDQAAVAIKAASASFASGAFATGSFLNATASDPCMFQAKTTAPFSTSSAGPVSIVALSGSTKVYVCSISAITDTAIKLSFIDGTGGSCASAQHAIWGSTTAASGMSLAANGGFAMGNGEGTVGSTAAASAFCLLQSGTSLVAGNITYVQQ